MNQDKLKHFQILYRLKNCLGDYFYYQYSNSNIKKRIDKNEYIKLIETLGETKQIKKLLYFTEIEKYIY